MPALDYPGAAKRAAATADFASGVLSITIDAATNWPDGSGGKFVVVVDPLEATAEKILISSRTGTTLTVDAAGRGYDGTSAASHTTGAVIYPVFDSESAQRHEDHIFDTDDAHDASAISYAGASGMVATNVEAAIDELAAAEITLTAAIAAIPANPTTATFYTTHTWALPTPAVESGDTDFIIPLTIRPASGETVEIESVSHKINSGTSVTWDLTRNGATVTGFTGLSSTTSGANTDPANVALAAGDKIKPDVSAASGTPRNWEVTVVLKHVVTLT